MSYISEIPTIIAHTSDFRPLSNARPDTTGSDHSPCTQVLERYIRLPYYVYFQNQAALISDGMSKAKMPVETSDTHLSAQNAPSISSRPGCQNVTGERGAEGSRETDRNRLGGGMGAGGGKGENKEMMHMLESTLITWTKQIKNVLTKVCYALQINRRPMVFSKECYRDGKPEDNTIIQLGDVWVI